MKAADISDTVFLEAVARRQAEQRWNPFLGRVLAGPALLGDLVADLDAPEKVVRAKARRLIRRGLLDGCPCGCRGDFMVNGSPTGHRSVVQSRPE